ncbi:uncharacterized protein LOC116347771 [Contarinia nasturtii]|uniref:uncharacterized protein LOC116347771 n=1 Tax=Contarinia nasturtii TaxID=265458 RepID=UPI0012D40E58|nr:uncharacterized protein LOC116347771 [Contarinia nasturtii]
MKVLLSFFIVSMAMLVTANPSNLEYDVQKLAFDFPVTEAQKQCMEKEWDKLVQKYPDLEPWFKDAKNIGEKLKLEAERCANLSGVKKAVCFAKLKSTELNEYRRLIDLLPSQHKFVLTEIKSALKGCMKA